LTSVFLIKFNLTSKNLALCILLNVLSNLNQTKYYNKRCKWKYSKKM